MAEQGATQNGANGQTSAWSDLGGRTIPVYLKGFEAESRCAVCLGIVKDCRLVAGCMHRFCSECIEKWLRLASEPACPQCRMQMQSRRDCKADSRFDRLMQHLYADLTCFEAQKELSLEDPAVSKGREVGRQLASAMEAQRAKRSMPDADRPVAASAPAGTAAASQQAKKKAKADSPAQGRDGSPAGASIGKGPEGRASKETKTGKQAAKKARQSAPRHPSPDLELGPTEEDAMQIAADLASKSAEARQWESQQVKPVIQVTISLPASDEECSQPERTLHATVPCSVTAAQLLQAIRDRAGSSCPEKAFLQIKTPMRKRKGSEKSLDKQLQPGKTLGWAVLRQKNCKKDLELHVVQS